MTDTPNAVAVALTNEMIKALEEGAANPKGWTPPWHAPRFFGASNAATGARYRGGNLLWLSLLEWSSETNAVAPWATYKQWESLGAQVRKGEKGTYIMQPVPGKRVEEDKNGNEVERRWVSFRARTVFHSGQVDGWIRPDEEPRVAVFGDVAAEAWLERFESVATVEWSGSQACFLPGADRVVIPPRNTFTDGSGLFATVWHEAGHWTGHESRLARPLVGNMRDPQYAQEELVAELTAALMGNQLGVTTGLRDDHRDYIAGWLRHLKDDVQFLWRAATAADKASAYLLELGKED